MKFNLIYSMVLFAFIISSCTDDEIITTEKLKLSNVLNFSYKTEINSSNQLVATLTIPENKVWKIESASLYLDYANNYSSCALTLNEYILFRDIDDYVLNTTPYLTQGVYKLTIVGGSINNDDFGYTALSVLEYDLN